MNEEQTPLALFAICMALLSLLAAMIAYNIVGIIANVLGALP